MSNGHLEKKQAGAEDALKQTPTRKQVVVPTPINAHILNITVHEAGSKSKSEVSFTISASEFDALKGESEEVETGGAFAAFLSRNDVQKFLLKYELDTAYFLLALRDSISSSDAKNKNIDLNVSRSPETNSKLYVHIQSVKDFETDVFQVIEEMQYERLKNVEGAEEQWGADLAEKYSAYRVTFSKPPSTSGPFLSGEDIIYSNQPPTKEERERARSNVDAVVFCRVDENKIGGELKKKIEDTVPSESKYKYLAFLEWAVDSRNFIALGMLDRLLTLREKNEDAISAEDFLQFAYDMKCVVYYPFSRGSYVGGIGTAFGVSQNSLDPYAISVYGYKKDLQRGYPEYGLQFNVSFDQEGNPILNADLSLKKFLFQVPVYSFGKNASSIASGGNNFYFMYGGVGFGFGEGGVVMRIGSFNIPLSGSSSSSSVFSMPAYILFPLIALQTALEAGPVIKTAETKQLAFVGTSYLFLEKIVPFQTLRELVEIVDLMFKEASSSNTEYYAFEQKLSKIKHLLEKDQYNSALAELESMFDYTTNSAVANPLLRYYLMGIQDIAIDMELIHFRGSSIKPSTEIRNRVNNAMDRLEELNKKISKEKPLEKAEYEEYLGIMLYLYSKMIFASKDGQIRSLNPTYFKNTSDYVRFAKLLYESSSNYGNIKLAYLGDRVKGENPTEEEKKRFLYGLSYLNSVVNSINSSEYSLYLDALVKTEKVKPDSDYNPNVFGYLLGESVIRVRDNLTYSETTLKVNKVLLESSALLDDLETEGIPEFDLKGSELISYLKTGKPAEAFFEHGYHPETLTGLENKYLVFFGLLEGIRFLKSNVKEGTNEYNEVQQLEGRFLKLLSEHIELGEAELTVIRGLLKAYSSDLDGVVESNLKASYSLGEEDQGWIALKDTWDKIVENKVVRGYTSWGGKAEDSLDIYAKQVTVLNEKIIEGTQRARFFGHENLLEYKNKEVLALQKKINDKYKELYSLQDEDGATGMSYYPAEGKFVKEELSQTELLEKINKLRTEIRDLKKELEEKKKENQEEGWQISQEAYVALASIGVLSIYSQKFSENKELKEIIDSELVKQFSKFESLMKDIGETGCYVALLHYPELIKEFTNNSLDYYEKLFGITDFGIRVEARAAIDSPEFYFNLVNTERYFAYYPSISSTNATPLFPSMEKKAELLYNIERELIERRNELTDLMQRINFGSITFKSKKEEKAFLDQLKGELDKITSAIEKTEKSMQELQEQYTIISRYYNLNTDWTIYYYTIPKKIE